MAPSSRYCGEQDRVVALQRTLHWLREALPETGTALEVGEQKVRVPDTFSGSIGFTPFHDLGAVAWIGQGLWGCYLPGGEALRPRMGRSLPPAGACSGRTVNLCTPDESGVR